MSPSSASSRSTGPPGASARPSGASSSMSRASRLARVMASSSPSIPAIEFVDTPGPSAPRARLVTPRAGVATPSPASAAARPILAGASAASARFLPRSMPPVYGRAAVCTGGIGAPGRRRGQSVLTASSQRPSKLCSCRCERMDGMTAPVAEKSDPEARILVVDDEENIVELLSVSLKFHGFEVHTAVNGAAALDRAREVRPDAVILDVMMPGMDGFGVLRRLRADGIDAPALFLTARDTLADKITGLTLGGDDYVTKPFSLEEVVARLRVILRRTGKGTEQPRSTRLTFADIELDEDTHEAWKAGELVSLSPTEFTLLRYFMINAGTVLSKPKILDHVWRYDFGGEVNIVESYVSYLRRKIDTGDKRLLHTLRGVGYVLREPR